ncbi:hypothetical protein TTHERM_000069209 (macronuclear) [Tetrahymena thermophila SB210]|uniref:EF-hand domain-containing protein n=1 Tax=Tetrahymena thermophila (strain SB210) TaxID=312017 RepID=W7XH43_TETTS|nr:hypothetical protein TTHERM_000069209 [Tetrahymena thermophila SB210]EWS76463.1 hypothetical protein TTHERM_000069209 [Tetrahymena thermophila SB210]|eukprot:XP_012651002.1 hypothetical protein TTHERM_000069209 [Tetrahymena thermophila SB210]
MSERFGFLTDPKLTSNYHGNKKNSNQNSFQHDQNASLQEYDFDFTEEEYIEFLKQANKYETNPYMRDISQQECDEFQKKLDNKYIQRIWKSFRESGNSDSGKISRQVFKKVFINIIDDQVRELFLDALFERFKLEKLSEKFEDSEFSKIVTQQNIDAEKVDIQDLVISLTILARMSEEQKLKLIFTLTDVDEDECLSTEDIRKMIQRIERNFTVEQSHIYSESSCLAQEFALNKSQRRYQWTIYNLGQKDLTKDNTKQEAGSISGSYELDENKLITWEEFIECLNKKQNLKRKFLPNNYLLYHCLKNTNKEKEYKINSDNANDFDVFRKLIHLKLRNFYEKDYTQAYPLKEKGIRYPGKIKIEPPPPDKKSDLLPNFQKTTDQKKLNTFVKDFKQQTSNLQKNFIEEQLKKMESQEDSYSKQFGSKPENSNNLKKFIEILEKQKGMNEVLDKYRAMKDNQIDFKI